MSDSGEVSAKFQKMLDQLKAESLMFDKAELLRLIKNDTDVRRALVRALEEEGKFMKRAGIV